MAFAAGGNAACSGAGNPLSQLTKHTQRDTSLLQDRAKRLNGQAGGPQLGHGQVGFLEPDLDVTLEADEFLIEQNRHFAAQFDMWNRGNGALPDLTSQMAGLSPFREEEFMQFMRTQPAPGSPLAMAEWHKFQQQHARHPKLDVAEFQEFMKSQAGPSPAPAATSFAAPIAQPSFGSYMGPYSMGMMPYRPMAMMGPSMGLHSMARPATQEADVKGKGKAAEVTVSDEEWTARFAAFDRARELEKQKSEEVKTTPEKPEEMDKEKEADEAIDRELGEMDQSILNSETDFNYLENLWRGVQAEQTELGETLDDDYLRSGMIGSRFDALDEDLHREYLFEEENLFKDRADPYEEGLRILQEGGNLSLAALAFEAAVQKNPQHIEAWVQLGSVQAQNEKESASIRALEQVLKQDPNNLAALMGLAISFINDGYDSSAFRSLERWLSVKYPNILSPSDLSSPKDVGFTDRQALHDRIIELYLEAAALSPDGDHMDPDVQVGLGVLFYSAEEFDKAIDCFSTALASHEYGTTNSRDQVHLLWNRLGATMANGGRSEEAIAAYEQALTLKPNFVRARYNLGVSCMNMKCPAEAAGHLLQALEMHWHVEKEGAARAREIVGDGTGGANVDELLWRHHNASVNLYETLRRAFNQMGRRDLAEKVITGVDPELFRKDIDF